VSPTEAPVAKRPSRVGAWLGAAIPIGWVGILLLLPYLFLFAHSFFRLKNGQLTHELTLENYGRLFGTALYPQTILFSAGIAAFIVASKYFVAPPKSPEASISTNAFASVMGSRGAASPIFWAGPVEAPAIRIIETPIATTLFFILAPPFSIPNPFSALMFFYLANKQTKKIT
jgi:hypothetical protein